MIFWIAIAQSVLEYETPNGYIRLSNISNSSVDLKDGVIVASGESSEKVVLQDTANGLALSGKTLRVTLKRLDSGKYSLLAASVVGAVDLQISNLEAHSGQNEALRKRNQPLLERPSSDQLWRLQCERAEFTRSGPTGILQAEGQVDVSYGWANRSEATRNLRVIGVNGKVNLRLTDDPLTVGVEQCHLLGPVKVDYDHCDPTAGTGLTLKATANELTGDFLHSDGIEVKLVGDVQGNVIDVRPNRGGGPPLTSNATVKSTEGVVVLDRVSREPLRFKFTGAPSTTTVRLGGATP